MTATSSCAAAGASPNYGPEDVAHALELLRAAGLPERVMIDLSHDNSGKDPYRQPAVAAAVAQQIAAGQRAIVGVMIESFLVGGRQDAGAAGGLTYGQSITDGCIDWDTTVEVLADLATGRPARRRQSPAERPPIGDADRGYRRRPDRRVGGARGA